MMTTKRLKEIFPEHSKEIDELQHGTCGCSVCVWRILHENHPELQLPPSVKEDVAWC